MTKKQSPVNGAQEVKEVKPEVSTLLTAEQVAQLLSIGRSTVYDLVKLHGLPAVRFGESNVRFRPEALQAWILAHEEKAS